MTRLLAQMAIETLPLHAPFVTAKGTWRERDVIVLRVASGRAIGFGEASPLPGFSRESFDACREDCERVVEGLRGASQPETIAAVTALVDAIDIKTPSARFACECALLDLLARSRGVTLRALLAGETGAPPDTIEVNATISAAAPSACAEQALGALERGFSTFKIKVAGRSLAEDVARVRAVREVVGRDATIRLDANGGWSRVEAIDALRALGEFRISLVEQPVASDDLEGLALVRESTGVRVAADEAIASRADFDALAERDAVDVIVLKPAMLGGLLAALDIQRAAHERGVTTVYTSLLDGAVARAAVAQLCAASPGLEGPCGVATGGIFVSDLVATPRVPAGGLLELGGTPGLGVVPEITFESGASDAHDSGAVIVPHPLYQYARYRADQIALVDASGSSWTYAELYERAVGYARALELAGVQRGDRVAVVAKNSVALATLIHGVALLGATLVALHPRLTCDELAPLLARSGANALIGSTGVWSDASMAPAHERLIWLEELEPVAGAALGDVPRIDFADDAVVMFTSGTTGAPKMVALTWQNLMFSATGSAIQLGHLPTDRWLATLPLCHIGGLSILVRCALLGTTVVLHDSFDARAVADAICDGEVTMMSVVSRMLWQVIDELDGRAVPRTFRVALVGGGPVPDALVAASGEVGIAVATTYGMTEGSSQLTTLPAELVAQGRRGAGFPLIWTELGVLGADARVHTGVHADGEIVVRGPTVITSYADDAVAVEQPAPGWFTTGDFGEILPGHHLQVLDRRADLIVTGGENVYPAEVEAALDQHDLVRESCVVGVPDEQWGQRVVAVIVPSSSAPSNEQLESYCRGRLAGFKIPRELHFWSEFPRSSLQKLSRGRVRQMLLDGDLSHSLSSDSKDTKRAP